MSASTLSRRAALLRAAASAAAFAGPASAAAQRPALRCDDVTAAPAVDLTPQAREEHTIFLALAMALVFDAWGVDVQRPDLLAAYAEAEPGRRFPSYLGHNVGALLVSDAGEIVCFALNRNVVLNSTLEHAEARAIRAGIGHLNAGAPSEGAGSWTFGRLLRSDRVYATLEPCAQCAGIMDLASIGSIIYGQDDPAQHHIVNVLYNLRRAPPQEPAGPLPVAATFAPSWAPLALAYEAFKANPAPDGRMGVTSFLETVAAYRVFRATADRLTGMRLEFAENAPKLAQALAFRVRWRDRVQDGLVPSDHSL